MSRGSGWLLVMVLGLNAASLRADERIEKLIAALNDPETPVVMSAMRRLGNYGTAAKKALPALSAFLRNGNPEVANQAARSLAQIGVASMPELLKGLKDPVRPVRERSLAALGLIGPEARIALPLVLSNLRSPAPEMRVLAAYALGEMGVEAGFGVKELGAALRDKNARVRAQASEALGLLGSAALPELTLALTNPDLDVRLDALRALGLLLADSRQTVPVLVNALKDDNEKIRAAAAQSLGRIGQQAKDALPGLVNAVMDQKRAVQIEAFNAVLRISALNNSSVLKELTQINDRGRWAGAHLQKQFGPKPQAAVKPLTQMLGSPNSALRLGAVLSLRELGPLAKEALPPLRRLLKDPDKVVRLGVAMTLPQINPKEKMDINKAKDRVDDLLQELKDQAEKIDTMELVQLHMLVTTLSELRGQRSALREFLDNLASTADLAEIPALVQGLNVSAQLELGFC